MQNGNGTTHAIFILMDNECTSCKSMPQATFKRSANQIDTTTIDKS